MAAPLHTEDTEQGVPGMPGVVDMWHGVLGMPPDKVVATTDGVGVRGRVFLHLEQLMTRLPRLPAVLRVSWAEHLPKRELQNHCAMK